MTKLRNWLRNWLGIVALGAEVTDRHLALEEKSRNDFKRIEDRVNKVNVLAQTGRLEAEALCSKVDAAMGGAIQEFRRKHEELSTAVQNLQDQITSLQSIDSPLAKSKPARRKGPRRR
jgi:hypothetical protein